MPANHPNPRPAGPPLTLQRRLWVSVALIVMLLAGAAPAVSADEIYNRTFAEIADTTIQSPDMRAGAGYEVPGIYISDVNALSSKTTLRQVESDLYGHGISGSAAERPTYHWDNVPLQIGGNTVGYADIGFFKFVDGETPKIRLYAWVHELDVSGYTGSQKVYFNFAGHEHSDFKVLNGQMPPAESGLIVRFCMSTNRVAQHRGWAIVWDSWENTVIVENSTQKNIELYSIDVKRNIDGKTNPSVCGLYTTLGYYLDTNYPNSSTNDIHFDHIQSNFFPMTVSLKNLITGTWHNDTISLGGSVDPAPDQSTSTVRVYIRNSQTGSLLANARLTIQDTTTDPWTEVVNETLSSGTGTFSLPIDTGLHLTQYRIGATVPGYQQVVPALFARVTGPTNIVVEMEPLAGGPADPDNTYLEFYVRDLNANGIPNANVLVDGKTRWTNAQGYTQFEVAKNGTYPYTVSKSGYMTIQGSAIVADGPRYVANVVLGPGTVPTHTPTLGPGETPGGPGATPTPDHRTNEQKGQAVIDMIADFAEPIALLAIVATVFGLMQMMMPRRR